jgi:hypothetical protein
MSPDTLPTVRKMSGTDSTATRMPSSSIGTPIAIEIGATLAMKEISPGRADRPDADRDGDEAADQNLVGREVDAEHGRAKEHDAKVCNRAGHAEHRNRQRQTMLATRSGTPRASRDRSTISGSEASEERLEIATASTGAVALAK